LTAAPVASLRRAAIAAAIAAAMALVGCGNGDGGATAVVPPPLSKPRLAERMGDICQAHTDRQVVAVSRFEKQHGIPSGKADQKQLEMELVLVILPIVRDTIHDVGRLRPPADEQSEFDAFIKALEHGVAVSERDPSWIATGDFEPFMRARETSAALGTYYCGQA
jgi:hypothetical protein